MSYNVAVVAEDPTNNGYILVPLLEALLAQCGKPHARVRVVTNPRTSGYEHAKALIRTNLIERYKYVDLLLFLPDADGKDRFDEFADLEAQAAATGTRLLCCAAEQEVEIWLLAGHPEKLATPWQTIRADASVKEHFFVPFIERYGDSKKPGSGRETLMREGCRNLEGLKARCPELTDLQIRIQQILNAASMPQ